MTYLGRVIAHNGSKVSYDNGSGTFADYAGSYNAPSGQKMRFLEANSNLYVTTDQGTQVFTDVAGTQARKAGAPRSLDPSYALNAATYGFLSAGNQCAYRVVIQRVDANNNILVGYPSTRLWVANPSSIASGTITCAGVLAADTVTVGSIVLSAVTGAATADQFDRSGSDAQTALNLASAINADSSLSSIGTATAAANVVTFKLNTAGASGNDTVLTSSNGTRLAVSGAGTLTGGTGTAKNVDLTLYLPSEVTTTDVVQVYRTAQQTGTSSDISGDEMALVYQLSPAVADINNGYMVFTDSVVDSLRGASLYTSPSQEGITQANDRPPLSKDIALYRSTYMFYANCSTPQRQFLSVVGGSLGTSSTASTTNAMTAVTLSAPNALITVGMKVTGTGIPANTTVSMVSGTSLTLSHAATATNASVTLNFVTPYTITIAGTTYSFADTENSASGVVGAGLSGIAASDIDTTARSLVRVINRYAANTSVYAYYESDPTTLPGLILLQERGVGAAAFTVLVSNAAIANQFSASGYNAPVSPTTSVYFTSSNQVQKNGLYYSKTQELEAVPGLNYFPVGSANESILRIIPLSDVLIIIKERSIYRLTGLDPNSFVVTPLDLTVVCKSADSVVALSNQVYMLSNQGVVSISSNSVQVVSRAIEPNILPLLTYSGISSYATGLAYESERSYILSVMSNATDTAQNQIYVYNIFTRTWVHWTFGFNAAIVEPSGDKLYFSKPGANRVYQERKDFSDTDYADPETAITITDIDFSKNQVTFTIAGTSPVVGGAIFQNGSGLPIVSMKVFPGSYVVKFAISPPTTWTNGAATYLPSVGMDIEWDAWKGPEGNEGMMKRLNEFAVLTDNVPGNNTATGINATFRTNLDEERDIVPIPIGGGGWGSAWGSTPWGGNGNPYVYRTWPTRNKAFFAFLNPGVQHVNAQEHLPIAGCAFLFEIASERSTR